MDRPEVVYIRSRFLLPRLCAIWARIIKDRARANIKGIWSRYKS